MNQTIPEDSNIQNARRLIWLYFWLLIFEGALRKWVAPQLSNPLLIIRDPVAIMIYFFAIRGRVFPTNGWSFALAVIAVLSFLVSYVPLWPYLLPSRITLVSGYGFRSNFLHLPLIFVIGRVFKWEDVKWVGWWTLVGLVPMAILMVGQFNTSPDSFLNRNAGGEGEMMTSALGKVRTAGTFSFVIGVVAYFALATGFLVWGALKRDVYRSWVLFAAGSALVIGIAVSGSRSVVGACAVVVASLAVVLFIRPTAVNRFGQALVATVVLGFIVTQTPIFKQGFHVLSTRFSEVAYVSEKSVGAGLVERVFGDFREGFFILRKAPFLGYGLGVGTNAGAKFLTGSNTFLLSESEWSRVFLESGPLLGLAYVLWRATLVVRIGLLCVASVKFGNVLPLLLFSSAFMPLLSGQFGQPTVLGFSVFVSGLALAAMKRDEDSEARTKEEAATAALPAKRPIARSSAYASRLHRPSTPRHDHTNGSVDR